MAASARTRTRPKARRLEQGESQVASYARLAETGNALKPPLAHVVPCPSFVDQLTAQKGRRFTGATDEKDSQNLEGGAGTSASIQICRALSGNASAQQ